MSKEVKDKIQLLIEKYKLVVGSGKLQNYTEEETKKDFILPLFQILGWDIFDKKEVTAEESQSGGRVDYGFYLDERLKFYLEAKSLKSDLRREDYANQVIKYSWNKGVTWAILTDFERIKVFNAQVIDRRLTDKLFFEIPCEQYVERLDQLWLLSKEAFQDNLIDKEAEKFGKKLQRVSVSTLLYKDLNECRDILTHDLSQWNPKVDKDLLDEGVQKLLDRLLFLRVAEDRGIEQPTLMPLIRQWELKGGKEHLYQSMVEKFRELDEIYNSNLFSPHPFEKWEEYSGATERVAKILYGKQGYYEYDFKAMPADVLGSVYENYLGYRLSQLQKGVSISKDAKKRKEQGIYYTPSFIVDYIVKNTLGPTLDKCKSIEDLQKIKVLDPACGSGSFLIEVMDLIYEKYKEFGNQGGVYTKLSILLENIYGVDLDPQAVEIARLNLLLNTLEGRAKLPFLDKNIKNGNSLVSGTDEELKKYFGNNFRDKKPFNWEEEFPEVFKQGGFDVVIGNPPYGAELTEPDKRYFCGVSKLSEYQLDTYILFIEKCIGLLKLKGILGFIIPNTWLTNIKVNKFRRFLVEETTIDKIVNYSNRVFPEATVDSVALLLQKDRPTQNHKIEIVLVDILGQKNNKILQSNWNDVPVFNIFTDNASKSVLEKIEINTNHLSEFCDVAAGVKPYEVGKGNPIQTKEMLQQRVYDSSSRKDGSYLPLLRGADIDKYVIRWEGKRWIKYGDNLAAPRKKANFNTKQKIVIRQTGDSLIATLDTSQFICMNNLHTINSKLESYDLRYILGLINSKVLNLYFQYLNPEKGEALAEVKAENVKKLPIKIIDKNNQEVYNEIIKSVERVLDLNKELKKFPENSNKWVEIKSEIEKLDKKIDEEVYRLYGLTPEEIAIVEKS